jgi:hypothetical protein
MFRHDRANCREYISNLNPFNHLNAELNPICHLLALLGVHHILHVSRIGVKVKWAKSKGYECHVVHYTANYCKTGTYSLKMALTCLNISKWSDHNVINTVSAFSCYIKWPHVDSNSDSSTKTRPAPGLWRQSKTAEAGSWPPTSNWSRG